MKKYQNFKAIKFSRHTIWLGLIVLLLNSCVSNRSDSSIYFGGDILTMQDSSKETIEAVLVKNGRIVSVGLQDEIFRQKEPETQLIDLQGKTLMPGFIAVHTHPDISAYLYDFVDLSGFSNKSPEDVWQKLKVAIANTPKGQWIFCKGFDPMLIPGLEAPNIKQLDDMAPDNPVAIIAQSLHSAWGNSLAFEEAGITENTPDPTPGSFYEKDDSGKLTGFISEVEAIRPFSEIAVKVFDIKGNVVKVFNDYVKNGYTSITTMGVLAKDSKPFMLYEYLSSHHPKLSHRMLDVAGMLPDKRNTLRHFVYIQHNTPFLFPKSVDNGDDFFKVLGLKMWYDGSPYTGSMYLKEPYLNSDLMNKGLNIPLNHRGKSVIDKKLFYETVKKYHDLGWQVSVHSQGDQSTKEVLDIMEEIIAITPDKDQRHRIEHGVLLPPELLGKFKELNMTASIHINHLYYYGRALRDEIIGQTRAEKMLPLASMKEKGLYYSLHADAPMYEEDPLSLLQTAVTRKTREGDVIGEHEKISVIDGLKALTIYSAWQLHMDKKIGSIEVGKYADFVILDKNPLKVLPDSLRDIKVLKTIINGEEISF